MTALLQRYLSLETFLQQHAGLWQPAPFHTPVPAWADTHGALYNALLALSDDDTLALEHDAGALQRWLAAYLPELEALPALTTLPTYQGDLPKVWPTGFEWDIPGRKWAQIEAFTAALTPGMRQLIDWCAGKGHLSRSLAFQHDAQVLALEFNPTLCQAAHKLNRKLHTNVATTLQDVLALDVDRHIREDCHCVALHACGKLHLQLMRAATRCNAPALSFSPCCYHLIDEEHYIPLATLENIPRTARLLPSRDQLRLAVQETVTANGHARRLRARKTVWRLAFMQILKDHALATDARLPSLADRFFHDTLPLFCQRAAQQLGVILPAGIDWDFYTAAGEQAYARLQRLELVRHGFRRALEVWLCLDRACWLEQQGYSVSLGTFCNANLTPRNILLSAVRTR